MAGRVGQIAFGAIPNVCRTADHSGRMIKNRAAQTNSMLAGTGSSGAQQLEVN